MGRRRASVARVWLRLKKKLGLEEPTPVIDQVCFGCAQRESVIQAPSVGTFAKITAVDTTEVKSKTKRDRDNKRRILELRHGGPW